MPSDREIFFVFFGIFWAVALEAAGRYRLFETSSMWGYTRPERKKHAWRRFWWGLGLLNFGPILVFIVTLKCVLTGDRGMCGTLAGAVAPISTFGWHRILHAYIASYRQWERYYDTDGIALARYGGNRLEQPETFWPHFGPGILYLIIPITLAALLSGSPEPRICRLTQALICFLAARPPFNCW
jgi:hypothetical protein